MTALAHHVYRTERLREAYERLHRRAAPGIDGFTWEAFGIGIDARLERLSHELATGTWRPLPMRRMLLPKPHGGVRLIQVSSVRDKVVQLALTRVLRAVFAFGHEDLVLGPLRSRAVRDGTRWLAIRQLRWVWRADVVGAFDHLCIPWLVSLIHRRVADPVLLAILRAAIGPGPGVPQGLVCSPVLCSIYLEEAFDRWVRRWAHARRGAVRFARYADDLIAGFERAEDAAAFAMAIDQRAAQRNLALHATGLQRNTDGTVFLGLARRLCDGRVARAPVGLRERLARVRTRAQLAGLHAHYARVVGRRRRIALEIAWKRER